MITMNLKEFEEMVLHSNENIQKIAESIVNESSNASLVAMYDDSVVLLDHNEGSFYKANYKFDNDNLKMTFENFEEFELSEDKTDFRSTLRNFFEEEDSDPKSLTESYVEDVLEQEKFINETINKALATKDFNEIVDYSEVAAANDELNISEETFFKKYAERMETHPVNESKYFNFKDPVVVSLIETENKKLVNSSLMEQAADIWKRESFRKLFNEACETLVEDVEEGAEELAEVFAEYPQIFFLDNADRKSVFGKALLNNSKLAEHVDDILTGIKSLMNEDENLISLQEYYLTEQEEEEEEEKEGDEEEKDKEKEAPELTPEELQKIADSLKKVAEKVESESLKIKLDDIISKLEGSVEEGTRPDLVKEAIQLLTI